MVQFSQDLKSNLHGPWIHAYVSYNDLKAQLELIKKFMEEEDTSKHSHHLEWLKLLYQRALDGEIHKVLDFYQSTVDMLHGTVDSLQERDKAIVLSVLNQKHLSTTVKLHVLNRHLEAWREAGRTVSNLLMFVALNMRALRKTVKKQHKYVRFSGQTHNKYVDDMIASVKHGSLKAGLAYSAIDAA